MAPSTQKDSDLPEAYRVSDQLPEVYTSPNETLEVTRKSEDKEIARSREDDAPEAYGSSAQDDSHKARRRRRWMVAAAVLLVLLAIALGVGLGVGLSSSSTGENTGANASGSSESTTTDGGLNTTDGGPNHEPPTQQYYSTRGAFNGSDVAVNFKSRLSVDGNLEDETYHGNALLFYQHYTGEIRWLQHIVPDTWQGGTASQVLATDAKNGTSIVAIENAGESSLEIHAFYIGTDNTVKQRWLSTNSPEWYDGPLNGMNYSVWSGEKVALRVGRYTGPVLGSNATSNAQNKCMKLFVGTSENTVDELAKCPDNDWTFQQTWGNVNGTAAPAYEGLTSDELTYTAFVDLENNLQLYWKDTTRGAQNTANHPLNQWTPASGVIAPNIDPSAGLSGLSGSGILIARDATNESITCWNVSLAAEDSTMSAATWSFGSRMLPNSALTVTLTPNNPDQQIALYYQAHGDDITMAPGSIAYGPMDAVTWPIPDD